MNFLHKSAPSSRSHSPSPKSDAAEARAILKTEVQAAVLGEFRMIKKANAHLVVMVDALKTFRDKLMGVERG